MGAIGNGLGDAATEVAKMQNLPVMNFADQLNRMEQTQLRILCELGDIRNELHQNVDGLRQNVGDLRQDFNRAYVNTITSTLLELITDSENRDGNNFVGPSLHL